MLDHEPDTTDNTPTADGAAESTPGSAPAAAAPRRRRAATRKAGPPAATAESATEAPAPDADTAKPVMAVEAAPSAGGQSEGRTTEAEQQAPPAKKATRKRATKSAEAGTRAPRKRTTKKAAAAAAAAEPPAATAPKAGVDAAPAEIGAPTEDLAASQPVAPTEGAAPAEGSAPAADPAPIEESLPASAAAVGEAAQGDTESGSPTADAALDEIRLALSAGAPATAPSEAAAAGGAKAPADEAHSVDEPTVADEAESADEIQSGDGTAVDDNAVDDTAVDDTAVDETADDTDAEEEDDADEGDESDASSEGDTDESGAPRRRRRRRGGRRRRRGGGGGSDTDDAQRGGAGDRHDLSGPAAQQPSDEQSGGELSSPGADAKPTEDDQETPAATGAADAGDAPDASDDGGGEEGSQRRRRRRRRRRGEDSGPSADDPAEVVVRVREPRSRQKAAQEVTGIEGSTRMEAKRQRRREGREAGRRRAPILSEAEFLARRESVVRKMIIRQREELSQIAVLEDDILVEHYVDRESAASLIGNVYLGRVQNVLPSMEAAFIDIGRGRNAVLYAGEVDWDAFGAGGQQRKVENVLKSGQSVLVQVTKDPVGAKGARLTSHITLPGRYIVYAPGGHLSGISRKLPDNERKRLKSVLNDLVPESASVIVRTAAEGASEDELVRDVNRLKAQWEDIERKVKAGSAPKLLYGEPDLTVRIVRDLFTEDFAELIIQGNGSASDAYEAVDAYVEHVAPHLHDRLRRWDPSAEGDLFATYRLDEQIAKALERKVFLPSGGSLIIDRTEAMTVIDVNTGKFTGSGGNLEATVTSNNLEAAEEIVRQLRLRDIGGIIVIDFIDMVLPSNRELLLRRLVECLGRDRTRHQVAEVTSLGLVQMTRKKIGTGLLEAFTTECEQCHGRGYEISDVPVETQKQPDGGSRDPRGGGRDRGRGRSGQSGSGPNGSNRPSHPVPTPPLNRPVPVPSSSPEGAADPVAPVAESVPAHEEPAHGPTPKPDQPTESVAQAPAATAETNQPDQVTPEPAPAG